MTLVDGLILLLVALMALQGFMRGFIVGAAALAGFIAGAIVGTRLGALFLHHGSHSPYAPLVGLLGALVLGGLMGTVFGGVARRVRRFLWIPGLRLVDGLLGAALSACIGFGLAWIVGAAALQGAATFSLSPNVRHSIESSAILRRLNSALPPSGPLLGALGRIDPLSGVGGRVADVAAPDPAIVHALGVRRAGASVVRVLGDCGGLGIEGSGWVAGPDMVVTNAHVVAGERNTTVQLDGIGRLLPATALVFDPHNDIAVLSVPGLDAPALTPASGPVSGESGAILGYPLDGPFDRQPARLGATETIATDNAYGNPTVRPVTLLRGLVRPGNSGGPMVNADGEVIATVFAEATNAPKDEPGGLAVPNSVVRHELARARATHAGVSTGGCAA